MNIKELAEGTSGSVRAALLALEAKVMMLEHDLAEAIEQHEAFKQEVSDVIEGYKADQPHIWKQSASGYFSHLIIPAPKPDPLVEVIAGWTGGTVLLASDLRAALQARGLEIRSKNDV